jgi:ABC-type Fe3+-hydroxamate transport system substrate-binding protein
MHRAVRVVSLVPSATETLLAWGVVPVACTRFCEQPTIEVTVGGTKDPDLASIVSLDPDVVVMCHEENRRPDADALVAAGVRVHVCSPATVDDVAPALADLAAVVGVSPPADLLGSVSGSARPAPLGLRAFVPIWRRPWMTIAGDTYGSSVLAAIGVANIATAWPQAEGAAGRYPETDLDRVRAETPDVVLAPSEPYSFKPAHLDVLAEIAPVVPVDGQDLFWWGVRTPGALARLHAAIATATGS